MHNLINRAMHRLCDAVDELLYGRELGIARAHQEAIDDISGTPVPYTLTPAAEALLSEADPETTSP